MKQKLNIFIFLYLFHVIISSPSISASINVEDISIQKCFSAENDQSNEKTNIYQITNNSTSNTIFIQYKSLSNIIISDSIKDEPTIIYKNSEKIGSYYLNMDISKNSYYVTISKNDNDFKICFISFCQKGNSFKLNDKTNNTIKTASYNLITNANLSYYIDNCDLKQNKIFNTIRFEQSLLDKVNIPKIQMSITFINSKRQNELYTIDKYYLQDKYYYVPFYIPKLNYSEKFTEIIICMNVEFKQTLLKDELFKFDLELIDTQEITHELDINLIQKEETKNNMVYPKVYFINLFQNIYKYDRDILLLKHDSDNKYIKPFLTTNINIHNNNSYFIQKDLIDLNQKSLSNITDNNKNCSIYLLILILDETINEIKTDAKENVFISFKFYGGYHDLLHYEDGISVEKFFNEDKNKILIKMPNCRTQYFINYFNQLVENKNDERILDIESAIGHMNLFYKNEIQGNSLDEYFNNLEEKCIHKFENSILSGNFGTLEISCPDNNPVMSYIYAHKKNMKEDLINFMDQKSLLYIEYNTQYSFKFNDTEKENDFIFRIKPLRTNIQDEDCKIEITYNNQNFILDKENPMQIFNYTKNSDANILIKINSNNIIANTTNKLNNTITNKGIILEVFKGIDTIKDNILYIEEETETETLPSNKMILFIYSKKEINSPYNIIQLYNTNNTQSTKINLCIRSGKGIHPFISKPICTEEDEYIIMKPGESLNLTYNNPYLNGKFDEPFYVSIIADNSIKYNYGYERLNNLEQDVYENLNHNGTKIIKLSNKKHDKKSIYYQINVCENKNSNFYYIINNSEKILINNDIYQECSLDEIKSPLVEFEGDGEQIAKFKYYYGYDKLLNKIEKFSKNIILSKSNDENGLLIVFQTPFVQQVDVKIIFGSGIEQKYKDFCTFEKFCKSNFNSGKFKLFSKISYPKDNEAIIYLDKKELKEFLNTDIDIYIIAKSIETNLEIFYNVKSVINFNLEQLDSDQQKNDEDKNYICINCGGNEEQNEKEEYKEKNEDKNNNNDEQEEKDNNNEENKNDQKNNDVDQPVINQNPINVINNNDNNNKDNNENNNNENNNDNNKENNNNDDNENNNNENNNNNDNNENNNNENNENNNINNNENKENENNNENDENKNVVINNINENNTETSENNNNKVEENNTYKNDESKPNTRNGEDYVNKNIFQRRGNNYGQNNKNGNDHPKNREDEKDGDIDNDKDNNNGQDHDKDNEQGFDNNENNENNSTNINKTFNENEINAPNQLNNVMRNDINPINNISNNENDIMINNNQTKVNGDNNTQQNLLYGETNAPKRKSRKFLYIMIIIICFALIYYIRNQWCNNSENVSYSKISKYSYYDF